MTDPASPPPLPPHSSARERAADRRRAATTSRIGRSRRWLLVIAILQIVFGIGFGYTNSRESDKALASLAELPADHQFEHEGEQLVIGDVRKQIERERVLGFAVPIGLGVAFVLLWLWAKRAALPAMVCALLLFVTVHAIDAAIDPTQLVRGILIKVLFLAALIGGIKAAVQQRVEERAAAPA